MINFFHFGSFGSPLRLFQRNEAIADEPPEGDRAIIHDAACRSVAVLFCDFLFQSLPCLKFRQLRFLAKDERNRVHFLFVFDWIEHRSCPAERPNPSDAMYPSVPHSSVGEQVGVAILRPDLLRRVAENRSCSAINSSILLAR
jgi:hypothetical protein